MLESHNTSPLLCKRSVGCCAAQKGFALVHSIHAHVGEELGLRFHI